MQSILNIFVDINLKGPEVTYNKSLLLVRIYSVGCDGLSLK